MKRKLMISNLLMALLLTALFIRIPSVEVQANGGSIEVSGVSDLEAIVANSGLEHQLMGKSGLEALATFVNRGSGVETSGVSFVLKEDPTTPNIVDGSGLKPIGHYLKNVSERTPFAFHGNFDGSGVTIENLRVTPYTNTANEVKDGVGLFGYTNIASIENVKISGVEIIVNGRDFVGSLVGRAERTTISGVSITGNIILNGNGYIGGIVGVSFNNSTITNSYLSVNYLTINGTFGLGGFIGSNWSDSSISNSYLHSVDITISGTNEASGGFAGQNTGESTISNSYLSANDLTINGTTELGGFAGSNSSSTITNSYLSANDLTINGTSDLGGFVGTSSSSTTTKSFLATSGIQITSITNASSIGAFIEPSSEKDVNYSFYNSGLEGNVWFEFPDTPPGDDINQIGTDELLVIVNSGLDAFMSTGTDNFPVLKDLANQTAVAIYWDLGAPPTPPTPPSEQTPPSTGSSTPVFRNPSIGETYTYDPAFLTIEVDEASVAVGEEFTLTYRGFSTFGPIIRDYTDDVVVTGTVNPNVVGTYTLTLSLTAEGLTTSKQVTITVVDTTPPVITGPSNVRLFVNDAYESQLTVNDNFDTNVLLTLLTELDTSSAKTEEVIWQATDASGNTSTFTQTVTIVVPEVRIETVVVGTQRFIFSVSEAEFDLTNLTVEYVVSSTQPSSSSNWQVYTTEPNLNPGERVFIRLSDGTNTSDIRQTIARPQEVVITQPVVTPEVETTSPNAGFIVFGSVVGLAAAGAGWWFLIAKRRKKDEEDEQQQQQ